MRRRQRARISFPGDWGGNTTCGHPGLPLKPPPGGCQPGFTAAAGNALKSPYTHQAPPGVGPRHPCSRQTPQIFSCTVRFENHHSSPAPMPDKKNPAAGGTLPVGRARQPTGSPLSIYTLARVLRSNEPSSQQPLPTGDIQVLEPLKRILSPPKAFKSGKTRVKSWLCLLLDV